MLLAFDTATPLVTVALYDGSEVVAEESSELPMKHGEQLAPLIADVLAAAGIDRRALTGVAVGAGPGPFTGLRVGMVTARTLGLALDIPVRAACTLDVLAVEAVATGSLGSPAEPFVVANDARRKEVYLASYDSDGNRVDGPTVVYPADAATDRPVVGGAPRLYPDSFPLAVGPERPSAGWLARAVAAGRVEPVEPEPLYLRRPDAVEQHARKSVLLDPPGR